MTLMILAIAQRISRDNLMDLAPLAMIIDAFGVMWIMVGIACYLGI